MLITIKNDFLTVTASTLGAELQSVSSPKTEFMWNGDAKFWSGRAPVLFPICSGLVNKQYKHKGVQYSLEQHGFAKVSEFTVEAQTSSSVTFLLMSNEQTRKLYPFDFEFRVKYALEDKTLVCTNTITNKSNETMYYSDGSHEGYACPGGVSNFSVHFSETETLRSHPFDGRLVDETELIAENTKDLPLKDEYFKIDALIFTDLKSKQISLCANDGSRKITLDFPEHPYLLIWSIPGAPYVCFEPWRGLPDTVRCSGEISEKEGINALPIGSTQTDTHKITFEDFN